MVTFLPFSFARNSIKNELYTASVKLGTLDASVCLSTYFYTLTKPIQTLHQVTKSFISYRLCMSIYLPTSLLESGKHQRFARSLNVGPFLIPPRPIHTAKGPGTPKLGRVFLVSVREKERGGGVITSTQFTCFPRPIFSPPPFSTDQILKHVPREKNKETKKKLWTEFNILFHSFLILVSLSFLFRPISLSLCAVFVSMTDLIVTCKQFA